MARQRWGFIHIAALALMGVLTACGGGKSSGSEGGFQVVVMPVVTSVSPTSAVVGSPLNLVLTGTDLTRSGGIAMQFSGCALALQAGGTDTTQTYQCTPTQAGSFSGTVKNASGAVLSNFTVNVHVTGVPASGFTKISASGQDLPDTAPTWSCVRHNATGLLWEAHVRRGVDATGRLIAHPCSYDATLTCYGYSNFGNGDPWDAPSVPTTVGSQCGVSGWRLPTEAEGRALVAEFVYVFNTYQTYQTWFGVDDAVGFGWTSSPVIGNLTSAWLIRFSGGYVSYGYRNDFIYSVRLVR